MSEHKRLSRKDFIKITAAAGGALVGGKLLMDVASGDFATVKETRLLMGTVINLAVVADRRSSAEAAVAAVFGELERQVGIFSHREEGSPLANLNRTGRLVEPPRELLEVLIQAQGMSEMTGGAFDVTVKPLVDLYQQSRPGLPGDDEIRSALNLADYRKLTVSTGEIVLGQPGMAVTLDGIAKGYIVDAGSAVLKRMGFENVFVEAGGDLMAGGKKEGDTPWKIGIQSPQGSLSDLLARITVSDQAAATSGDYFQFFSEDRMNHHIIDPRSGFSSPELASATVLSERAVKSDALATAVMVLGTAGLDLIESSSGSEALLVTKEGAMLKSSGFPEI